MSMCASRGSCTLRTSIYFLWKLFIISTRLHSKRLCSYKNCIVFHFLDCSKLLHIIYFDDNMLSHIRIAIFLIINKFTSNILFKKLSNILQYKFLHHNISVLFTDNMYCSLLYEIILGCVLYCLKSRLSKTRWISWMNVRLCVCISDDFVSNSRTWV